MAVNSGAKKIIVYILLFPPMALLIYAVASYIIFFNFKYNVQRDIIQIEKRNSPLLSQKELAFKAEIIKKLLQEEPLEDFLKNDVSYLDKHYSGRIAILEGEKILYPKKLSPQLAKLLKKLPYNNLYEDNSYTIYAIAYKDKKIAIYCDKQKLLKKNQEVKETINTIAQESFFKSLLFLTLIWFIIVVFSALLAFWIYKILRKYEETLEESNRSIIFQSRQALLGELLPMIAHQWRQPLNKIAAVLMRMRFEIAKGNPDTSTLDRQCQTIENSVELMSNTIDDFRSFYRPKEEPEPTDLSIVVRKAIYFLDELLEKKKVNISTHLAPTVTRIHANEFLQVVINLIKNASDAVDENGHIDISLKTRADSTIELRIEDDGTGIPQDKLEKIFEPHESTKQGSMGLGLYMSKLIVESHFKGTIQAYNTSKGAGFIIIIPKNNT